MFFTNALRFALVASPILLIAGFLSIYLPKGEIVLLLNQANTPFFDVWNKYITHTGSGFILLASFSVALFYRFRIAATIVILSIVQGIVVAFFKVYLLPQQPRPLHYFDGKVDLHLIEGVSPLFFRSFPSGHTLTAFCIATFFASFSTSKSWHLLMLGYATLVAISRIYLAHHFLIDTVAGAFLGVLIALGTIQLMNNQAFNHPFYDRRITIRPS